jgi:hypothetical protein
VACLASGGAGARAARHAEPTGPRPLDRAASVRARRDGRACRPRGRGGGAAVGADTRAGPARRAPLRRARVRDRNLVVPARSTARRRPGGTARGRAWRWTHFVVRGVPCRRAHGAPPAVLPSPGGGSRRPPSAVPPVVRFVTADCPCSLAAPSPRPPPVRPAACPSLPRRPPWASRPRPAAARTRPTASPPPTAARSRGVRWRWAIWCASTRARSRPATPCRARSAPGAWPAIGRAAVIVADTANPAGGFTDGRVREHRGHVRHAWSTRWTCALRRAHRPRRKRAGDHLLHGARSTSTRPQNSSFVGGFFWNRDLFPRTRRGRVPWEQRRRDVLHARAPTRRAR